MESPQSVASSFNGSAVIHEKQHKDFFVQNLGRLPKGNEVDGSESMGGNFESSVGSLEVYIHQARDIHNICIYHKQDVYAKLCLTSDPENTVSTKIINGGGRNPVFNENLQVNVRTVESSLKCEVWMLSRVRNYLEDQLLGFALVPLSEIVMANGNLEKEFSLSSTDLYHTPAGFVQLSLSYTGASPEVMVISAPPTSLVADEPVKVSEAPESLTNELDRIEFPDPKIANENQMMVSEYFGIPCSSVDTQSSESLVASDAGTQFDSDLGIQLVESFSTATIESVPVPKHASPPSSVSTNGVSFASVVASSELSDDHAPSKDSSQEHSSRSPNDEHVSPAKDGIVRSGDGESDSSGGLSSSKTAKPVVTVKIEPEQNVVQQDIVNMYMKSMQQFTESLAKMKLPMDTENDTTSPGSSSTDQQMEASKTNGSRVFYGSRAFF